MEASQSVMVDQQQLQMPRVLMEVFSVKFLEFNQHDFDQMYGCILMNLNPTYVVFSRKQGGPLNITPEVIFGQFILIWFSFQFILKLFFDRIISGLICIS